MDSQSWSKNTAIEESIACCCWQSMTTNSKELFLCNARRNNKLDFLINFFWKETVHVIHFVITANAFKIGTLKSNVL